MNSSNHNAFSIDVEDYFQVESFSKVISRNSWDQRECRVEENTKRVLGLMEKHNVKGTFFVLGWVAKRYPELVRYIYQNGHEIASHGMSHKLIYTQSEDEFYSETKDSKLLLEDIIQDEVIGYRAATYSITNDSLWALDILIDLGFKYDSSIFPIKHDRYGIPELYPYPHVYTTRSNQKIVEFPISTVRFPKFNFPISGGGYFRLFPYLFTKYGLRHINNNGNSFVFYLHPWEIDVNQPIISEASSSSKFRHYNNINKCEGRLEKLFKDFDFTTIKNVLVEKYRFTL